MPAASYPSGDQHRISYGEQHATITEVGAAVREYAVGGRDVVQPYGEREVSWGYHGSVLLPWPNRIRDGRYEHEGATLQLPLTEPDRANAIHGLSPWRSWSVLDRAADRIALQLRLLPSPGYPFMLTSVVEYRLTDDGLAVQTTSTNEGDSALPYALGFHPYISCGAGAMLDGCTLRIDASRKLVADERLIPIGDEPVEGGDYDFRAERSLSGRVLDDGFFDVNADADGRSWVRLGCPDGRTVALWADKSFGFWQVYSGDYLPEHLARRSLAIEPMTAAPNAFQSGRGLRRLASGESVSTTWGVVLL